MREVAARLVTHFGGSLPRGYLKGKTTIRNAAMQLYGLSALQAETLVEQLVARGFVRYAGLADEVDRDVDPWLIEAEPRGVRPTSH